MSRTLLLCGLLALCWSRFPAAAPAQEFLKKDLRTWLVDLDKSDASVRRNAAFALGQISDGSAVPALKRRLKSDPDPRVREAAAFALGEIVTVARGAAADPELLAILCEALKSDNDMVRRSAAYAIGCLKELGKSAVDHLVAAQNDKNPAVRQNVAWSLAKLGSVGIPGLKKALHDEDALVKRDAATSMEPLDAAIVRPLVPDLAALCLEKNSDVRRAALGVLVKAVVQEDVGLAPIIQAALSDNDEEVRNFAALTLSNIGGQPAAVAVPQLLNALKQQIIPELRLQAAVGIRNIGPFAKSAVPELIKTLSDADDELRGHAALALGGIGPDAEAAYMPLVQVLENARERPDTRIEASFALSRIGVKKPPVAVRAVPRLLKVLGDAGVAPRVRERIVWALRVHGGDLRQIDSVYPTFNKVLLEAKTHESRMLRYDCAYMLSMLQGPEVKEAPVFDTLHEFLKDNTIQIFKGKTANVTGAGIETRTGKTSVEESGKGDGRVMAVQALDKIGKSVADHANIVVELRRLAGDANIDGDLRKGSAELLKSLGK